MKPLGLALALVLLVVSLAPAPANAAACQFVLGFKTLHDSIPGIVGDCVVEQRYSPQNGDSLQDTTKGLLVWRKADNFTAFTDGYRTWVNGPYGIQERLNTERFDWEVRAGVPDATTGVIPSTAVPPPPGITPDVSPPSTPSLVPAPPPPPQPGPLLPTYKGMNMAYGIRPNGAWVDGPWLTPGNFYPEVVAASLDGIVSMGARTVGTWIWLPAFVTNISEVVNPDFVPAWDQAALDNWRAYLRMLADRDMKVVATLSIASEPRTDMRPVRTIPGQDIMIQNGVKPVAYDNWVRLHRDFIASNVSEPVALWVVLKEGPILMFGDFMADVYRAVKADLPAPPPFAIDVQWQGYNSSETARVKAAQACDVWSFHSYADAPDVLLPADFGRWQDRPILIGEYGAAVIQRPDGTWDYSHLQDPAYQTPAVEAHLNLGRRIGALAVMPWVWGGVTWSRINAATQQFYLVGTGLFLKQWNG